MTNEVVAACACGKVELEATGAPIATAICYCNACQAGGRMIEALPNAPKVLNDDGGTDYILYRKARARVTKGAELLKPLKLSVFEASDADWAKVTEPPRMKNQRNPDMFKIKSIKADRELYKDAAYQPDFTNVPIEISEVEVDLNDEEMALLSRLAATGKYGETDAEVLRYVFHTWWIDKFMRGPKHVPKD